MINISFPDGQVREFEKGVTPMDVALSISEGLARNVLAAKLNDEVVDASTPIDSDSSLQLLTWNDDEGKKTFWHSSAHLLAEAIEALYPGTKFGIGPAIEHGFYYDIDLGGKEFGSDQFKEIEDKILELARQKSEYIRKSVSKSDAIAYFKDKDDE
jgi:threonyl-tRNA synthetase